MKEMMEVMNNNKKKRHLFRGHLHYQEESNKIEVVLGSQESMTITDEMLTHMTGWPEKDFEMVNMRVSLMQTVLPYMCQFDTNGEQMMVYTNIIEYSKVGLENMALLCTLHLESDGLPCYRKCIEIQYHHLSLKRKDSIHILLLNTFGHNMDFKYRTHLMVILHFCCHAAFIHNEENELKEVTRLTVGTMRRRCAQT